MKAELLQENLSKALNVASRFSSSRSQLPIIANILLKAEKNKVILSATNLEMSVSINLGAKVEEEGEITVPSRSFYEIVSNLPKGQINLVSVKDQLEIHTKGFKSNLLGLNAAEFPKLPSIKTEESTSLTGKDLLQLLSKTLFSVSVDETRPVLTGALVQFGENTIDFITTDGFRLSRKSLSTESKFSGFTSIIPKNILMELSRILEEGESLTFSFNKEENQVIFSFAGFTLSSRIIDGNFPDFERILPKKSDLVIEIDKEDFSRVIKLASVFARDSSNIAKLKVKGEVLSVESESSRSGTQSSEIEAKVIKNEKEGESAPFLIAFNYKFVEEFLNVTSSETVVLSFTDSNSPVIFGDPEDKNFLHIIMPVRLQS